MYTITSKCRAVSNYIIEEINKYNEYKKLLREEVIMSTKRLQRLLYLCDVEYMKRNGGTPLFTDDFNAWPSGPVIADAYGVFMQYQDGNMKPMYKGEVIELTDDVKSIIDEILDATKELDTADLMDITNIVDGPWHKVYEEEDKNHRQVVSKEESYNFYVGRNLFEQIPKINDENIHEKPFTIRRHNNAIILQKNNQVFGIDQSSDDDIWFSTSQDKMNVELSLSSRNYAEWQTYIVFEYLIKCIVGRYMLNGENEKEYTGLPDDFIDFKNKVITWHSDSGTDNVLKFEYTDNRTIKISISKYEGSKDYHNNSVRIRTSGSEYGYYYQEFLEFFRHLLVLEQRLNNKEPIVQQKVQEDKSQPKRLFLFKKRNNDNTNKK